jgi:polygalacturonase
MNFRMHTGVLAVLAILSAPACTRDGARAGGASAADAAPWSMADEIAARIELPKIPGRRFDIADFGAVPDDGQDDRSAILSAVAAASAAGGGRVILPAGLWYSAGPVILQSHVELHLDDGATLLFSPHAADYLPVVRTRWEGTMMMGYSPLIYAADVEDVAITGKGLIDGNVDSEFHDWNSDAHDPRLPQADILRLRKMGADGVPIAERVFGEGTYLRPSAIQFLGARRVLLEDYTIRNSPFWVDHLVFTQHATVRRIGVDSHRGNNDGVDVDSSSYVLIDDNRFRTGDDSVVVKSGRDRDGRDIGVPSEYVVVRNNDMGGEDGIALGSEMSGDIRFVFFEDNVLHSGSSALRFKASLDRGGVVEHIRVRNLSVEDFDTLFWFQLIRGDETDGRFPSTYRDIVIEDVRAGTVGQFLTVKAPATAPLRDVTLRDVSVGAATRTFDLENVERLRLDNVTVGDQQIDGTLSWRAQR